MATLYVALKSISAKVENNRQFISLTVVKVTLKAKQLYQASNNIIHINETIISNT